MTCGEGQRLQAYFDDELDAPGARDLERHIDTCQDCRGLLDDLRSARRALREQAPYYRAGPALESRLEAALDRETGGAPARAAPVVRRWGFWSGAFGGALATAVMAAVGVIAFMPPATPLLVNDVVNAHLDSLLEDHLLDVASTDHHTVKPWFAGRVDVSPPAADFPDAGYSLVGGRLDYVAGHRAAVTVYRHGAHVINVFAWPAGRESLPADTTKDGYHAVFWRSGTVTYCAVSDTSFEELLSLKRLVAARAAGDGRE
jgi:anti-sigma factor RsiW